MKRLRKIAGLIAGLVLVAAAVHLSIAGGQNPLHIESSAGSKDLRVRAVTIVRLINTTEVRDCRLKDGKIDESEKFLPWDELLNAPCFNRTQSRIVFADGAPSFSPGQEIVPDLELRLVVSADGKHYNLWVGQKPAGCGSAFYSDERGVIYEGRALGCDGQKIPGTP